MAIKTVPQFSTKKDDLGEKREEKVQKQFKMVLSELIQLLRTSTDTETVYLYWVNKHRGQLVLESVATRVNNTMFQDRVAFENHFLNDYLDITEPIIIEVGKHISAEQLTHYYNTVPVRYITLIPFINNGETVAVTALESKFNSLRDDEEEAIEAYALALGHLLHTYMELSDLSENQAQWIQYSEQLDKVLNQRNTVSLIQQAMQLIQKNMRYGGVSFLTRNLEEWSVVANAEQAFNALPLGLGLDEQTIVYEALQTGKPVFNIHFNGNPKRVNVAEPMSNGATLAVPLLVNDRRQGVFVCYDENPLIFNESTKHKIINTVRSVALKLESPKFGSSVDKDLFAVVHGLLDPDFWRATLATEIKRARIYPKTKSYFGFMTIGDLQSIRSKYRLDDLQKMQFDVVRLANPSQLGIAGMLGQFSDYVYAFIIQGTDDQSITKWVKAVNKVFQQPIVMKDGSTKTIRMHFGFTYIREDVSDEEQVISEAKTALSHALKNPDVPVFEY
ncbi:GAF domain-containing protein [bacterium]|nr:MAG: GAF domain-containing protein [bacterium]